MDLDFDDAIESERKLGLMVTLLNDDEIDRLSLFGSLFLNAPSWSWRSVTVSRHWHFEVTTAILSKRFSLQLWGPM
jgi:hypothetical protein